MANVQEVVGNINPIEVIQENTLACLPAVLLSETDPDRHLTQDDIIRIMSEDGLFDPRDGGASLYPAHALDITTRKLGLETTYVFDARLETTNEEPKITDRIKRVDAALQRGEHVILAFPKRRGDDPTFLHYCTVTGYELIDGEPLVTLLDPSDVDGGIKKLGWQEFLPYLTPTAGVPVMAWGVRKVSGESTHRGFGVEQNAKTPGVTLLESPYADAADTGLQIPPGTLHPCSVTMPTEAITKEFSLLGDVVLSRRGKLPAGYPRFVVPPLVRELSQHALGNFDGLPFGTRQAAESAAYLGATYGGEDSQITEHSGLFWLPSSKMNVDGWQHTGLGISSRQALAVIEGRGTSDQERLDTAELAIKQMIEQHTGANHDDIYLFPTGMAAIYYLNQALIAAWDGAPAVQFGFPYTDTLEQRRFGPERNVNKNILDFRSGDYAALAELVGSGQPLRGLITEYPGNPTLATPDFERLDRVLDEKTQIVVDDTIGTMFNLDDSKLPVSVAARVTSLTKFFSSVGDVMGGSIVLRPQSPHYERLKAALDTLYTDTLWYEDAEVLAKNSKYFPQIMPVINRNAESLAGWMHENQTGARKPLEIVYHPSLVDRKAYDAVRRKAAGYGGLMSLKFNDPERAYRFFDALQVSKGPSLGTFYTLGCLYTWLAHKPVDSVSRFGVVPDLVRISTGIEPVHVLRYRFERAFAQSA